MNFCIPKNRHRHSFLGRGEHELGGNENGAWRPGERNQRNGTFDRARGILWNPLLFVGLEEWLGNKFAGWRTQLSIYVCIAADIAVVVRRRMGSCSVHDQGDTRSAMEVWSRRENGIHCCIARRPQCESSSKGLSHAHCRFSSLHSNIFVLCLWTS